MDAPVDAPGTSIGQFPGFLTWTSEQPVSLAYNPVYACVTCTHAQPLTRR